MGKETKQNSYCVECECPIRKIVYYESTEAKNIEDAKNIIQSQFPTMIIRSVSLIINKENAEQHNLEQHTHEQNHKQHNPEHENVKNS